MKKNLTILVCLFSMMYSAQAQNPTIAEGLHALENDQFNTAKSTFMRLLNSDAITSAQAYYYLGSAYYKTGKHDSASIMTNKLNSLQPENPITKIALGREALFAKNPVEAKANFDNAVTLTKGKGPLVYQLIGDAYLNSPMPEYKTAVEFLQKGIIGDKTASELYLLYGDASKRDVNGGGTAATAYEKAVELNSKVKGNHRLGILWTESRNMETAISAFEACINEDPTYVAAYRDMAEMYYLFKKYTQARDTYQKYLAAADTTVENLTRYAYMLYQSKDYDNGIAVFNQLKQMDSTNNTLNRLEGYTLCEKKAWPDAVAAMEKFFAKADPAKIIFLDYKYYGKALMENKQDSLAELNIQKAIAMDTTECDLYNDLGDVNMRLKRYAVAQGAYQKKMACAGSQSAVDFFQLGKSYYFNDQFEIADSCFKKVIEIKPASSVGYFWSARALLYKKENNIDEANPMFDKYIEIIAPDPSKASKKEMVEAYLFKGKYNILKDDNAQAKEFLNKVLTIDAENKEALELMDRIAKDNANREKKKQ